MTGSPAIPAYRSALRKRAPPRTGEPSSENPAAPASAISPIGARASPARPTVTAPYGSRRTGDPLASAAPRRRASTAGSSAGGRRVGLVPTVGDPPWGGAAGP